MTIFKKFAWYGSSVAFATVLALALLVTGPAQTAEAANEAITGVEITRTSEVAGATTTYTVVFTNGTAGGANNTALTAGDTITVDFAGTGVVGTIQVLAATTVTVGTGITGCTGTTTVASGGDGNAAVVTLGAGCAVANDAVGVTLTLGNVRNGAVAAAAALGAVTTNGLVDDGTAGNDTTTNATTAAGIATAATAGIGIGADVTTTPAVGGNFYVSAYLNVAGGAVSFSTTNGVFASTNTAALTCLDAATCDLDATANMVTVLVVGNSVAGAGTVSASFAGATSTKVVTFVGGAASAAVTPTAAQNIAATGGAVTLTVTFSDSNGAAIPAGSVVTVTTNLGVLSLVGVVQDAGATAGACAGQACTNGATSNTGTYKVSLTGGGAAGTATVTFSTGTVSATKTVTLSGTTASITSVGSEYDTNSVNGVFATTTEVANGATPAAATITNGFRVKATLKDSAGTIVGGVTPTIASTTSGVTFAACGASSATTGIATCVVTAQPTTAGTVVNFTITVAGTPAVTATGTWKVGATFSSTTSTVEVAAADIAPVTSGPITVTLKDSAGNLVGDGTSVTLVVTAGALVAATAQSIDGVATFTYVSPSAAQQVNATALVGTKTGTKTFSVGAVAPTPTEGEGTFASAPAESGVSIVVFNGGTVAQLAETAAGLDVVSVSATVDGAFVVYIVGAPAFVNAAFNAAFPDGLAAGTAVILKK